MAGETLASWLGRARAHMRNCAVSQELFCEMNPLLDAMERGTAPADVVAQCDALRSSGAGTYRGRDALDALCLAARHYAKGERVGHATTVGPAELTRECAR